jgi:hypothetical protein
MGIVATYTQTDVNAPKKAMPNHIRKIEAGTLRVEILAASIDRGLLTRVATAASVDGPCAARTNPPSEIEMGEAAFWLWVLTTIRIPWHLFLSMTCADHGAFPFD